MTWAEINRYGYMAALFGGIGGTIAWMAGVSWPKVLVASALAGMGGIWWVWTTDMRP